LKLLQRTNEDLETTITFLDDQSLWLDSVSGQSETRRHFFFCLVLGTLQPAQAQAALIYDSRDTKSRITQADKNSESKWVGNERRAGQALNWIKSLTKKKKKKLHLPGQLWLGWGVYLPTLPKSVWYMDTVDASQRFTHTLH